MAPPTLQAFFYFLFGTTSRLFPAALFTLIIVGVISTPAVQKEQQEYAVALQKADDLYHAKKYNEAMKEAKLALKLNKKSPEANQLLALLYRQENKPKDAIKHLTESVKLAPQNVASRYLLAVLLLETNQSAKALAELTAAENLGGNFPNLHFVKGDLILTQGKYKDAVAAYEKGLSLSKADDPDAAAYREKMEALNEHLSAKDKYADDILVRPVPITRPLPNYTNLARDNKIRGVVKVLVRVDETGNVTAVLLLSRLGWGLDEEAVKVVKQIRFKPASSNGVPIHYWVRFDVEFDIE